MLSHGDAPMGLRFRAGAGLAAVLVTALALAGCGSSGGSSSTSSGSSATSGASPAAKAPGLTDQTLTMQFTPPVSLNPALGGTSESDVVFGALDYESLIYQTGSGAYIPDIATAWSYKAGSGNKDFDMTIRPGVRFSDGSVVSAQAVVNSLEYFKKSGGPQSAYLAGLKSATASGDHVDLSFAAAAPNLPFLFSQYQDVGQIIGPKGIADPGALTTTSDGAGPYVLSRSQSVANSSYTFTMNSHYWDPKAVHYKTVVVKVVSDPQTAVSAAQSGQIQALTSLPPKAAMSAKAAGLTTFSEPFSIASLFLMDRAGTISPLGKLQVREAINDAVDRPALAAGLGGTGAVATDETAIPGTTGYDPALASKYPYNVAKAKQLLAAAGYPHGFTLPVLDTLALDANGDIAAELKSELAAIGITVKITETPSPAQFTPASLSKKFPAVIWPFSQNGYGYPYSVDFSLVPFTNAFGTTSPQLTALMNAAGSQTSQAGQAAGYEKVNDYLTDNAWFVPLFTLQAVLATTKSVANVQPSSTENTTIDPIAPNPALSWYPTTS